MDTLPSGSAPHPEDIQAPSLDVIAFTPLPMERIRYAPFFRRFFAYFLDNLLLVAFTCFVTAATIGDITTALTDFDKLLFVAELAYGLNTAAFIGYFTITTGSSGQTVGKYLLGVKVSLDGGGEIGYARAFVRSLSYFVSGFFVYLGFLFAIFSKKSQAFHDLISGTVVLEKN
jgi:uncharacterized RDD family membrane protein YckC